jgi:hypothetical protein
MTTLIPLTTSPRAAGAVGVEAAAVAHELLEDVGTRWPHVQTAGAVARRLAILFPRDEADLLVAAATAHDIGYAPSIARTGFHPLDGALFLRREGFPERMASLVAHHSLAHLTADLHGIDDLDHQFGREDSLLADALVFADMHAAPAGRMIPAEQRLADIARRHTHPRVELRDSLLRASIARVELALARSTRHPCTPGAAPRRVPEPPVPRLPSPPRVAS